MRDLGTKSFEMISRSKLVPTKKLLYFIFVGGIGFVIDGGLLMLLSQVYLFNIYLSRLVSFFVAVLTTWGLNRTLVFKHDRDPAMSKIAEYGRYITVQIGGGLINLFAFTLIIASYPPMKDMPIIPFFIGSIFGLFFNFTGARFWVFRKQRSKELNV
jgi:putative flippase GtrA